MWRAWVVCLAVLAGSPATWRSASASAVCPSRVLVHGEEALQPTSMGFFELLENTTSQEQEGRPIYSNAWGEVLFYWASLQSWLIGPSHLSSVANIRSHGSSAQAQCPTAVVDWQIWIDGSTWSSSSRVYVRPANKTDHLTFHAEVIGALGSSIGSPLRVGAILAAASSATSSRSSEAIAYGYRTFANWVNAERGGVHIAGDRRPLQITLISDASEVSEMTWRLVDAGIDLLLGPDRSELAEAIGAVAAAAGATAVLPAAASRTTFEGRPSVFGTQPAIERQLDSSLQQLAASGAKSLHLIYGNETTTQVTEMCSNISNMALSVGFPSVDAQQGTGMSVAQLVDTLQGAASSLDVVVGCMDAPHCHELVRELQAQTVAPLALLLPACVGQPGFFSEVGAAGHFAWGAVPWVAEDRASAPNVGSSSAVEFAQAVAQEFLGDPARWIEASVLPVSAFVAVDALVHAVEAAGSSAPSSVAMALASLDINTAFGRLSFDSAGQSNLDWIPVQYTSRPGSVNDLLLRTGNSTVYPAPDWDARPCFVLSSNTSGVGLSTALTCGVCPQPSIPHIRGGVWPHLDAWTCAVLHCPGISPLHCSECPGGAAPLQDMQSAAGSYWQIDCEVCPPGRAAVGQACEPCPPGQEAISAGLRSCTPCPNGTFADSAGTSQCTDCPPGQVSENMATSCKECPVGTFSEKLPGTRMRLCALCPVGTYQSATGMSHCIPCPPGTACNNLGTSVLVNLPDWWSRPNATESCSDSEGTGLTACTQSTQQDWFPCALSGTCLAGEMCQKGSTGIVCGVCMPEYTKLGGKCTQCPEWAWNLVASFAIGLLCGGGMVALTAISIQGAGKAKSIMSMLLKLGLNYSTTMIIMKQVFDLVLMQLTRDRLWRDPNASESAAAEFFRISSSIMGASIEDLQGEIWSLSCLWHPVLDDYDKAIIKGVGDANNTARPSYQEGIDKLRNFHEFVEFRNLLFWALIMPGLIIGLLIIFAVVLRIYMRIRRPFYEETATYFRRMGKMKPERAQKGLTRKMIEKYQSMAEWRFLGIWKAIIIYRVRNQKLMVIYRYLHDSLPLAVVIAFVLYPFCLRSLLQPLRCQQPTDENDGPRMDLSMDIECEWDKSSRIHTMSLASATGLGISLPLLLGLAIHVKRHQFHHPHVQRTFHFLTGGYELNRCSWECIVLVRKTLGFVVAYVQMNLSTRLLMMTLLANIFLFLHVKYQPFDNRYNELLDRVETVHLVAWNMFALILLAIYMLDDEQEVIIAVLVSSLLLIHVIFVITLVGAVFRQVGTGYALRLSQTAAAMMQGMRGVRPPLEAIAQAERDQKRYFNAWVLSKFAARMDRMPYLAVTLTSKGFCWVTLCGNRGQKCPLPRIRRRGLHEVELPLDVSKPSASSAQYALRIIFDAIELLVLNQGLPALSASLMEFIFRTGFTFGVDGTFRIQEDQVIHGSDGGRVEPTKFGNALFRISWLFQPNRGAAFSIDTTDSGRNSGSGYQGHTDLEDVDAAERTDTPSKSSPSPHGLTGSEQLAAFYRDDGADLRATAAGGMMSPEMTLADSSAIKVARLGRKWAGKISAKDSEKNREMRAESFRRQIHKMYSSECFEQGLTLEEFQLNLTAKLGSTSSPELKEWLDMFEKEWMEHRQAVAESSKPADHSQPGSHTSVSTIRNRHVRDASAQVIYENFAPEEILKSTYQMSLPRDMAPAEDEGEPDDGDEEDDFEEALGLISGSQGNFIRKRMQQAGLLKSQRSLSRSLSRGEETEPLLVMDPCELRWARFGLLKLMNISRDSAFASARDKAFACVDRTQHQQVIAQHEEDRTKRVYERLEVARTEATTRCVELGNRITSLRKKVREVRGQMLKDCSALLSSPVSFV